MRMLRIARAAAEAHTAERRIREAEKHMAPSGEYELAPGDLVLVWRENEGWTGPFTFLDRIGGTAFVYVGKERRSFPATKVKPYPSKNDGDSDEKSPADGEHKT
jgi:hypothetical protein